MSTSDNLWDEQEMAELVGLQLQDSTPNSEPEPPQSNQSSATPPEQPVTQNAAQVMSLAASEPLLDPEDLETEPPPPAKLSLATNPFTKLGVVAAGTGLVIGVLAVFTHGVMSGGSAQLADETQSDTVDQPSEAESEVTTDNRGELLTDLAMGQQQAELAALSDENNQPEPPETIDAPEFSSTPPPPSPPSPPPQPRQTVPVARHPTPPPRVAPPPPRAVTPIPVRSSPPTPTRPTPEGDPMTQWLALAKVGSYGRGTSSGEVQPAEPTAPNQPEPLPTHSVLTSQPSSKASTPTRVSTQHRPAVPPKASIPPEINHLEEAAILLEQPMLPSSVVITGTQAPGILKTPLVWAEGTENSEDNPARFIVDLAEPLLTPEGAIALPAATQFVVEVASIGEQGLTHLNVVAFIQNNQEIGLPDHAIQLRGPDGIPLVAETYGDRRGERTRMDLSIAAIAGLSRAAELINRPRSSSVVTTSGGSAITQETDKPDIVAGLLEGAFGQLTDQLTERQEVARDTLLNRPVIWVLDIGTSVELFINQTIAL